MNTKRFNKILAFAFLISFNYTFSQEKVNVILIGTYHFNNPGNDMIKMKNKNILEQENQKELEKITSKIIKKYKPDQIFVEELFSKKEKLNNDYKQYLNDNLKSVYDTIKNPRLKKKYEENEIYQFAFRLGKKANNKIIFPIDEFTEFRFDLLMKKIEEDKSLKKDFEKIVAKSSNGMNNCLIEKNLSNVFLCLNTNEALKDNKGMYMFINKIGLEENYFGSNLVTSWYERNLKMYSNFQNQLNIKSKNVLILVGQGHASMFYDFLKNDERINLIELQKVF